LIELLIVVLVLGIMGAIVVFATQNLSSSTAASACMSDARSVVTGVEAYRAQTGTDPLNVDALTVAGTAPDLVTVVGPWLRATPSDKHYVIRTSNGIVTVDSPAGDPTPLAAPLDVSQVPDACAQATA
jgi:type II secretory pathway pseudopilin PulG